jgi:predicted phosphodiesterase
MKLLVLADLHNDFWQSRFLDPFADCEDLIEGVGSVILAGDVAHLPLQRWPDAFSFLRSKVGDVPIAIFPGNHDHYEFYLDAEDAMADCAKAYDVTYAQKHVLVYGDTRILCCTLWSDFKLGGELEENKRRIALHLNDFRLIKMQGETPSRRAVPDDFIQVHEDHLAWLEGKLSEPWDGRTIVVTHHAPHPSILKKYDLDLSAGFGSDLSHLMTGETAPELWLYGHTHDLGDGRVGRTDIRAVTLGYPQDVRALQTRRERIERMLVEV